MKKTLLSPARRLHSAILTASISALLAPAPVNAATYFWDGTDTTANADGGAGTWNTTDSNWDTLLIGGVDTLWGNTSADEAFFGGLGGAVTLGSGLTANKLTFDVGGYALSGAQTLTLAGTTPTISVTNAIDSASISSALAGTVGLTTGGAGTLTLSGTNTFSNGLNITGGQVNVSATGNLGAATQVITLSNGGTLGVGFTYDPGTGTRSIVTGTGGGGLNVGSGFTMTLNDANQLSGAGALTKSGAGTLILGQSGVSFGSFTGGLNVNGGTVSVVNSVGVMMRTPALRQSPR